MQDLLHYIKDTELRIQILSKEVQNLTKRKEHISSLGLDSRTSSILKEEIEKEIKSEESLLSTLEQYKDILQ